MEYYIGIYSEEGTLLTVKMQCFSQQEAVYKFQKFLDGTIGHNMNENAEIRVRPMSKIPEI